MKHLQDREVFKLYTGGAYVPGERSLRKIRAALDDIRGQYNICTGSYAYYVAFRLSAGYPPKTSPAYLQRTDWIVGATVLSRFYYDRKHTFIHLGDILRKELQRASELVGDADTTYIMKLYGTITCVEALLRKKALRKPDTLPEDMRRRCLIRYYGLPEYQDVMTETGKYITEWEDII